MKQNYFLIILFFLFFSTNGFGQYLETFSIQDRGVTGCPGSTGGCHLSDYTGVDWTVNGNFAGFDSDDFIETNSSGVLFFSGDIDEELCFESPILNIAPLAGDFSISADIVWNHHDNAEYVDVEYNIDGAGWVTVANQFGGKVGHTVDFPGSGVTGSGTVTQTGLSGSNTLSVRICVDSNTASSGESHTIDNVSVPEAGVSLLPVELLYFEAVEAEKKVTLNWSTAIEINNEKFEIEHSSDGRHFEKLMEVTGKGSTELMSKYSVIHEQPAFGNNYYRLKQIDFDGKYEYSEIEMVVLEINDTRHGNFYPNPNNFGIVFLDYSAHRNSSIELSIYDVTGKYISGQRIEVAKGENLVSYNIESLPEGVYLIGVKDEFNAVLQKLVID